jgi:metal-responsive CopG/Arc/MetJ family transcriptional regulator
MVKMTFTFDEETTQTLRRAASRLKKSQSAVVREAIQDYANRTDRLSEEERGHMLRILDRMMARAPKRTQADVDAEIRAVRAARRTGGRRTIPK